MRATDIAFGLCLTIEFAGALFYALDGKPELAFALLTLGIATTALYLGFREGRRMYEPLEEIRDLLRGKLDRRKEEMAHTHEFQIWESKADGGWYWKLVALQNHEPIAEGGEGFSSKWAITKSIENVQRRATDAPIVEIPDPDA